MGRVLEQFTSLARDVIAMLTHPTGRGVDCRGLASDMKKSLSECPDQFTPRLSIQLPSFQNRCHCVGNAPSLPLDGTDGEQPSFGIDMRY